MQAIPHRRLFRFGIFEADSHTGELRKQGRRVPLQGQPFDILLMLLDRPGELVSRTEIRERLWPDGTFVDFDHSLNTAINKLRDVLGDSAASPRFIETLARRGYRFIAPVDQSPVPQPTSEVAPADPLPANLPPQPAAEAVIATSTLLTSPHEIPSASRSLVRTLFLLLQIMYFCFYLIALARLHDAEEVIAASFAHPLWIFTLLIVTAVIGIPIRLYLISMVAFKAPGLRPKFLRLFPVIFPLDELWALAPFLLLPQIGYGLALGLTAILLYAPFAQRSLILMPARSPES
ncbi:MAG TPA: winged helix-turn-helix domain-containing protein [Candidatus Sulfotelmatobacter sp.]|nr:winged helix-turn-helix domain-containing protein [Candidatus Sulfotelmatobacter sp.]